MDIQSSKQHQNSKAGELSEMAASDLLLWYLDDLQDEYLSLDGMKDKSEHDKGILEGYRRAIEMLSSRLQVMHDSEH